MPIYNAAGLNKNNGYSLAGNKKRVGSPHYKKVSFRMLMENEHFKFRLASRYTWRISHGIVENIQTRKKLDIDGRMNRREVFVFKHY